ncbi:MAG: hypothetical protein NC400_10725 [Clostridium sp.]|nr:hypothetical protein [Clostridium sp.]
MEENKETFSYTYSAAEQEEIKRIREKYAPATEKEDKMERLRRLDADTTKGAALVSIVVGIVSALVLGVGMCCILVWAENMFIPGIFIGIIGIAGIIAAYPLYTSMVKKKRKELAPEILRLSEELMR